MHAGAARLIVESGGPMLDERGVAQLEQPFRRLGVERTGSENGVGLSAEKLLEQAWDKNADPFIKTVQVSMGRLRRKLGDPNIISTIPGIGYRTAATAQANPVTPHQA